jgi:hypothetical protein
VKSFLFTVFFLSSLLTMAAKQPGLTIYADTTGNDSLRKLISILKEQLLRSERITINEKNAAAFNGAGIYLAAASPGKQKIQPSSALVSAGTEAFSIIANGRSVQIIGRSNMALGHGIFTWLQALGYRFYFPQKDWHIVPSRLDVYKKLNILSKPAFDHRRIVYGYGSGSKPAEDDFYFWEMANKMPGAMNAIFGHSYDDIMLRNADEFKRHPEWFYPKGTAGTLAVNPKFDMSQESLIQLIIKDVENRIEQSKKEKTQAYKMITLAPSDGMGICNTPACQQLGTPTDRVFYLVNRVAKAIQKKYPDSWIGCLAYNDYSEAPTKKTEPNVFVGLTTAFNQSKYSIDQQLKIWSAKAGKVGMYDYFSLYLWDYDVPGQMQASQVNNLCASVRKYYKLGAKGYQAETSTGWIGKGLGLYIVSQLMWDINYDVAAGKKEFFTLCFGKASGLMQKIWDEWEVYGYTMAREADMARWIDWVNEAERTEPDAVVAKRLFQIRSYIYYLYLLRNYRLSKTESDLQLLLSFCFRMLDYGSIAGYPAFFELGDVSLIPGMGYAGESKWRSNKTPVSAKELRSVLDNARKKIKIFEPVKSYTTEKELIKLPPGVKWVEGTKYVQGNNNAFWFPGEWVMQITKKGPGNYIEFNGGFVSGGGVARPITITVYSYTATGDVTGKQPLLTYSYRDTMKLQKIALDKLNAGFYTIIVDDPIKIYVMNFSKPVNFSFVMRSSKMLYVAGGDHFYFRVPKEVMRFNVFKSRVVRFLTPAGREIDFNNDKIEDLQVEVKPGEDGLWKITFLADKLYLEGVPPYIGTSPGQMLVPKNIN